MTREPWPVGKPFPAALTDLQLMSVLQISTATFYRYKKAGALDRFKLTDPVGPAMWSGKKVDAYVNETPAPHEFQTKAFGSARRLLATASLVALLPVSAVHASQPDASTPTVPLNSLERSSW